MILPVRPAGRPFACRYECEAFSPGSWRYYHNAPGEYREGRGHLWAIACLHGVTVELHVKSFTHTHAFAWRDKWPGVLLVAKIINETVDSCLLMLHQKGGGKREGNKLRPFGLSRRLEGEKIIACKCVRLRVHYLVVFLVPVVGGRFFRCCIRSRARRCLPLAR